MRTLAIDTSHPVGTVAATDGLRQAVRSLGPAGEHAAVLTARLAEVAEELGFRLADADLVAVVRGPGSFTGLRVGVATAKAIAWAGEMPLVGLSGFELVAVETTRLTGWSESPLRIGFDAGRGEVYAASVAIDAARPAGWRVEPAVILPAGDWIAGLPPLSRVSGPAAASHAAAIAAAGHAVGPSGGWFPSATAALAVAERRFAANATDDPHRLVPEYLRPSYADERRPAVS